MTDLAPETATEAPKPARKKVKRRVKQARQPAAAKTADAPIQGGQFAGVSATRCCDACTAGRCVISTVDQCKHPYKSGDAGCGPITMANRAKVRKLIKHQMIEMRE